jgi:hypothetical protein
MGLLGMRQLAASLAISKNLFTAKGAKEKLTAEYAERRREIYSSHEFKMLLSSAPSAYSAVDFFFVAHFALFASFAVNGFANCPAAYKLIAREFRKAVGFPRFAREFRKSLLRS